MEKEKELELNAVSFCCEKARELLVGQLGTVLYCTYRFFGAKATPQLHLLTASLPLLVPHPRVVDLTVSRKARGPQTQ